MNKDNKGLSFIEYTLLYLYPYGYLSQKVLYDINKNHYNTIDHQCY